MYEIYVNSIKDKDQSVKKYIERKSPYTRFSIMEPASVKGNDNVLATMLSTFSDQDIKQQANNLPIVLFQFSSWVHPYSASLDGELTQLPQVIFCMNLLDRLKKVGSSIANNENLKNFKKNIVEFELKKWENIEKSRKNQLGYYETGIKSSFQKMVELYQSILDRLNA